MPGKLASAQQESIGVARGRRDPRAAAAASATSAFDALWSPAAGRWTRRVDGADAVDVEHDPVGRPIDDLPR